ncbi:ATP-binding protein [Micromonospora sp. NPDC007220]|uniref:NACHT domain-containing protein n=1 Tax=Micromonospora sp. NPDC007220 TaxID=3154318 RepID=UPI0034042616
MSSSSMSFDTARRILGQRDPEWSNKLSALLGLAALGSGAVGFAVPAIKAGWGWIDQKNELVSQLTSAVDRVRDRCLGARGRERHELIAAAHTAVVTGAFFAALSEVVGKKYARLGLTEAEKQQLVSGSVDGDHESMVSYLLNVPMPMPWAACGFETNLAASVAPFYENLTGRCLRFFRGLDAWQRIEPEIRDSDDGRTLASVVVSRAITRYRNDYRRLAAEVPEFGMWALLDQFEHATAARKSARQRSEEFQRRSLSLMEQLLAGLSRMRERDLPTERSRTIMAQRNRQLLSEPLAHVTKIDLESGLSMPDTETGYVNPRFQWAVMSGSSRAWDEEWWGQQRRGHRLDHFLAAYFTSARSAELPLVILGHPGAGKSLLTKIMAARLPPEHFTTVRVPLRQVRNPAAKIYEQIQDFLDDDTHLGVRWRDLSEASREATRVVILDGLDELMQATRTTESGFLHEVREFQEKEAKLGSPVSVVVTSRTVVADIANIPAGSLVVKLEDFDRNQVDHWVDMWNKVNQEPIGNGTVKPLAVDSVWAMGELARQPLLLLMLAVFGATEDPPTGGDGQVTQAQVYQWLLNGYIAREVAKTPGTATNLLSEDEEIAARADHELWQLAIAAFAMFNRGQQSVTGQDLNSDLAPMLRAGAAQGSHRKRLAQPLDPAIRTIARFFFIHAADVSGVVSGSSYEFLHATFGEYLIAYHVLEQLKGLADARRRLPVGQEWTDDQFFALLSHQQLSVGGAIMPFLRELFEATPTAQRRAIVAELKALVRFSQEREGVGRFEGYNPSSRFLLGRVAAYLGNLLTLLTELCDGPVPLDELAPEGDDQLTWWRSTVRFLHAGLDDNGWSMLLSSIDLSVTDEVPAIGKRRAPIDRLLIHPYEARLAGDPERELQLLLGATALHGRRLAHWGDGTGDVCMKIVSSLVHRDERSGDHEAIMDAAASSASPETGNLFVEYLVRHAGRLSYKDVRKLAQTALWMNSTQAAVRIAPVVAQHPRLFIEYPRLLSIYERGLTDAREIAEVFAAMRVGLAVWQGDDAEAFKEIVGHLVARQRGRWREVAIQPIKGLSNLSIEVMRPAIPPLVAILADDYQRRPPVPAYYSSLSSGRHREDGPVQDRRPDRSN